MEDRLYRLRPIAPKETGDLYTALGSAAKSSQWRLPRDLFAALSLCARPATLRDHAARIQQEFRLLSMAALDVEALLHRCLALGLMASDAEILNSLVSRKAPAHKPISHLVVPTRGARAGLTPVLESHLSNARRFGRDPNVTIVWDGEPSTAAAELEHSLADRFSGHQGRVSVVTLEERRLLAQQVAAVAGIDPGIVRFALLGTLATVSPGACRNSALLLTAGELVLSVDDDVPCRTVPIGKRDSLALFPSGNEEILTIEPAAAECELPRACESDSIDLFGSHEVLLGRTLGECLAQFEGSVHLGSGDTLTSVLRNAAEPTVAITQAGLIGDCARDTPWFLLFARKALRQAWARDDSRFSAVLASRLMTHAAAQHTVLYGGDFMSFCCGLDNRTILPPFLPVLRGEDAVFAGLTPLCTGGLQGLIPLAVSHRPPESRQYAESHLAGSVGGSGPSWLLQGLFLLSRSASAEPSNAFASTGRALLTVAESETAFADWALNARRTILVRQMEILNGRLQEASHDCLWRSELVTAVERAEHLLRDHALICPGDPAERNGPPGSMTFRELVTQFAHLLIAWPAIYQAARQLKLRGDWLARGD